MITGVSKSVVITGVGKSVVTGVRKGVITGVSKRGSLLSEKVCLLVLVKV